MKSLHNTLAVALATLMLLNSVSSVRACGPSETQPIFVFKESPDLPFEEFTNGKIGIVRPTFGRKTLVVAYRYLNGGSFTSDEQSELVAALQGKAPEGDGEEPIQAWINGRKEFLQEDQKLPEIYTERTHGAYDFFPNCTTNAFEVALQTLKDRAASYGAEDRNVRAWLAAQDMVFENCSGGAQIPPELGAESVSWLRKDRDYQIAAAHFYSLNFDEARARFQKISADADSPWQEIAGYLIGRTLIRQASLGEDETKKRDLYAQAENHLQNLVVTGGKYAAASKKLLALVKYHLRPEERVVELGRGLAAGNHDNLRQDLIDYVWLIDKLESRIMKAEEERKKQQQPVQEPEPASNLTEEQKEKQAKRERGDLLHITLFGKKPDGTPDYMQRYSVEVEYDTSEAAVLAAFEQGLGRKLTQDETEDIKATRTSQLSYRKFRISPIRRWDRGGLSQHEGCFFYFECTRLTLDLVPDFLRADDLTDWILAVQTPDSTAYNYALSKWRETDSPAWLVTALMKAEKSAPGVRRLMQAAEGVTRDEPMFATAAYHLIRLKADLGQIDEARRRLDEIISWQSEVLPVSAQNQFLEQRMHLATGLNEFLKSAQRKPVAFYEFGTYGKLSQLLTIQKTFWNPEYSEQTKEEYERELEQHYKDLLPWDDRFSFDDRTVDIFNWHFPLQVLAEAARNPNVPDYLQRGLVLAAWTRAILLKNDAMAQKIAPEVVRVEPKISAVFKQYLKARSPKERHTAALYVLLKFPNLSPFVEGGLPSFVTSEEIEYYFQGFWWCRPSDTEFNEVYEEMPKVVPKPNFLTAAQLETARREHVALVAVGNAHSYLGKQVLEWTKTSPADRRIAEALFIAAKANDQYKYGCDGWEYDEKTRGQAETMLRRRYPQSSWTAKLTETQN